jgi:hypothetical protein
MLCGYHGIQPDHRLSGAIVQSAAFTEQGLLIGLRRRRLVCLCGTSTMARYDKSRRRWRHLDFDACQVLGWRPASSASTAAPAHGRTEQAVEHRLTHYSRQAASNCATLASKKVTTSCGTPSRCVCYMLAWTSRHRAVALSSPHDESDLRSALDTYACQSRARGRLGSAPEAHCRHHARRCGHSPSTVHEVQPSIEPGGARR